MESEGIGFNYIIFFPIQTLTALVGIYWSKDCKSGVLGMSLLWEELPCSIAHVNNSCCVLFDHWDGFLKILASIPKSLAHT